MDELDYNYGYPFVTLDMFEKQPSRTELLQEIARRSMEPKNLKYYIPERFRYLGCLECLADREPYV